MGFQLYANYGIRSSEVSSIPLAGLMLWTESSNTDASNIVQSANKVSQWTDLSVNSKNLVQLTANEQPLTNTNTINTLNSITFDSVDDNLVADNFDMQSIGTGGFSIFMVISRTAATRGDYYSFRDPLDTSDEFTLLSTNDGKYTRVFIRENTSIVYDSGPTRIGADPIDNGANILSFIKNDSNSLSTYVNGNIDINGAATSFDFNNFTTAADLMIGKINDDLLPFNGDIAEIIVYDRFLSATEQDLVNNYLKTKWGIFSPTDISGSVLWVDASDSGNRSIVSGNVETLTDKTGNGNDYTQTTVSDRPLLNVSDLNGLDTMNYTLGTSKRMITGAVSGMIDDKRTIITLQKREVSNYQTICQSFNWSAASSFFLAFNPSTQQHMSFNTNSAVNGPGGAVFTTPEVANGQWDIITGVIDGSNLVVYVNKTQVSSVSYTAPIDLVNADASGWRIGGVPPGGGDFAEAIAYNRVLTDAERDSVVDYLNLKWGL